MYVDERLNSLVPLAFCATTILLLAVISFGINKIELGGISPEQHLEIAIQEGYTTYLDGEQIDIATVDPDDYMITVDNKNDKIYLSRPRFLDPKGMIKVKN